MKIFIAQKSPNKIDLDNVLIDFDGLFIMQLFL